MFAQQLLMHNSKSHCKISDIFQNKDHIWEWSGWHFKKKKKEKIRIVLFKPSLNDRTHTGNSSLNITLVSLHFV